MSRLTIERLFPARRILPNRRSSSLRRSTKTLFGDRRPTVTFAPPPASGRPSVELAARNWLLAANAALISLPGVLRNVPASWTSIRGTVYTPYIFTCVSIGDARWQYCAGRHIAGVFGVCDAWAPV